MKEIRLIGKYGVGKTALVDDEDYEELNKYKWHALKGGYAARTARNKKERKVECILMHRYVMGMISGSPEIDHKDRNRLNCQKYNLRTATHQQNMMNMSANNNAASKYVGVTILRSGRCMARLMANGIRVHVGTFDTEEEAAKQRDAAALFYRGEYTSLNFEENRNFNISPIASQIYIPYIASYLKNMEKKFLFSLPLDVYNRLKESMAKHGYKELVPFLRHIVIEFLKKEK